MANGRERTLALRCPSCGLKGEAHALLPRDNHGHLAILDIPRWFRLMKIDYTLEATRFGCPSCKIPVTTSIVMPF